MLLNQTRRTPSVLRLFLKLREQIQAHFLAARRVGRAINQPGDEFVRLGLVLQFLEPDDAGIDEIEPVDVVRDVALAVLHEAQRRSAGEDDVLAALGRGGQRAEKDQRKEGDRKAHGGRGKLPEGGAGEKGKNFEAGGLN